MIFVDRIVSVQLVKREFVVFFFFGNSFSDELYNFLDELSDFVDPAIEAMPQNENLSERL